VRITDRREGGRYYLVEEGLTKIGRVDALVENYLDEARRIVASAASTSGACDEPVASDVVSADFEHLRWFELPAACLRP